MGPSIQPITIFKNISTDTPPKSFILSRKYIRTNPRSIANTHDNFELGLEDHFHILNIEPTGGPKNPTIVKKTKNTYNTLLSTTLHHTTLCCRKAASFNGWPMAKGRIEYYVESTQGRVHTLRFSLWSTFGLNHYLFE